MPSLNSHSTSSGEGWSIPWKAVISVVLIGCAGYYTWYQYERLHPKPPARPEVRKPPTQQELLNRNLQGILVKLDLTEEQKKKLAALESTTTDPVQMRRQATRLLTPEQRKRAAELRKEAQAAALLKRQERQERQKRMMPGPDLQYAQEANKRMQAERQARKKAAKTGSATAAPAPAGAGGNAS